MLRNGVGIKGDPISPENIVMKVYGSTLLVLQGGGWVSNFQEKNVM